MKLTDLVYHIKPPCPKCPYTLGQVKFVQNPCPECKSNDYQTYKMLVRGKCSFDETLGTKRDAQTDSSAQKRNHAGESRLGTTINDNSPENIKRHMKEQQLLRDRQTEKKQ